MVDGLAQQLVRGWALADVQALPLAHPPAHTAVRSHLFPLLLLLFLLPPQIHPALVLRPQQRRLLPQRRLRLLRRLHGGRVLAGAAGPADLGPRRIQAPRGLRRQQAPLPGSDPLLDLRVQQSTAETKTKGKLMCVRACARMCA